MHTFILLHQVEKIGSTVNCNTTQKKWVSIKR